MLPAILENQVWRRHPERAAMRAEVAFCRAHRAHCDASAGSLHRWACTAA